MSRFLLYHLAVFLLLPALAFPYTVVRKDGKRFTGELIQQTEKEIVLKDREGVTISFRSDQIDWDQTTGQNRWIGERSSFSWFVLKYLLGYPKVKNYDGSWTEWGSIVGYPVEK